MREQDSTDARLAAEAARLREALARPESEIEDLLAATLRRLRSAPQSRTADEGVSLMHALLEPICGSGTADAAIRAAGGARLPWREFIANLSAAVGAICGTTAGDLVFRAGLCLRVTEAA